MFEGRNVEDYAVHKSHKAVSVGGNGLHKELEVVLVDGDVLHEGLQVFGVAIAVKKDLEELLFPENIEKYLDSGFILEDVLHEEVKT